jgi:cell division protein FtsZ
VTRGLGCGANPDKGRAAALEDRERLRDLLTGSDMVFVTAGLGGGTGTGAAPIVAEVAREVGALTVAVVTKPFPFEGRIRTRHADQGLEELRRVVDTLITIPNSRLLALAGKQTALTDAFKLADAVLLNAVKGISDLITVHGLINLDFADVRTIMNEMGQALMGTGVGRGDTRATDAAQAAISSPLLEDVSIDGARGVLINISGGPDMTLYEVNEASTQVQEAAHEDANIIFGAVLDESIPEGELRVTVIATGLDDPPGDRGSRWTEPEASQEFLPPPIVPAQEAPAPVAEARAELAPATIPEPAEVAAETVAEFAPEVEQGNMPTDELLRDLGGADFISPFDEEDELDVPAFLRNKKAKQA